MLSTVLLILLNVAFGTCTVQRPPSIINLVFTKNSQKIFFRSELMMSINSKRLIGLRLAFIIVLLRILYLYIDNPLRMYYEDRYISSKYIWPWLWEYIYKGNEQSYSWVFDRYIQDNHAFYHFEQLHSQCQNDTLPQHIKQQALKETDFYMQYNRKKKDINKIYHKELNDIEWSFNCIIDNIWIYLDMKKNCYNNKLNVKKRYKIQLDDLELKRIETLQDYACSEIEKKYEEIALDVAKSEYITLRQQVCEEKEKILSLLSLPGRIVFEQEYSQPQYNKKLNNPCISYVHCDAEINEEADTFESILKLKNICQVKDHPAIKLFNIGRDINNEWHKRMNGTWEAMLKSMENGQGPR